MIIFEVERETVGTFHQPEIPDISVRNQMERTISVWCDRPGHFGREKK